MSLSTNLISGLSSGFDWRTMIDELMAIEHRRVDLVENKKTDYELKLAILQAFNVNLLSFKTKAETLSSSDAFNVFTSSLSTDSANYSASSFLSVSTSTSAAPGSHTITMNSNSSVAQARQISSKSFSTYDTGLDLTGEFVINGRAVSVESSDDLNDIRDKINNLNSGINATGVTASILTASSSNYRLILMSDETGEDAFTIFDASIDTVNILSDDLGFTDGTTSVKNYVSNGFQSEAFSSSTQAVGSMLGLSSAQDGSVTIGNCDAIAIDLSQDSLTDIAEAINDRADFLGSNVSASVVSTTTSGVTTYRLKIENTTGCTDDDNVLQTLGLLKGDQGDVAEVHHGGEVLYSDAGATTPIVAGTAWNAVRDSDGTLCDVANGDIILIKGTKHDGTAVDTSFTITDKTWTINETDHSFLAAIENAFGSVTAEIDAGKIKVTDNTAGDSQLSVTLVCQNNASGGTLDFGTISATTEGYTMETQAGLDANIIIDGTAVTSSSNIIDDVIAGVTLNLLAVEDLESTDDDVHVNLTISRDHATVKSSVQGLLDSYNEIITAINKQFYYDEATQTAGLLQGDGTLSSIKSSLQSIVVDTITGLSTTMNALSLIGINSDNNGILSINNDDFTDALEDNFSGLRRVFIAEGTTTDGDVEYINHTKDTVAGEYAVNITQVATQAQESGTVDLDPGGITGIETITITDGGKTAGITLDGDGNGNSIDNIVNAINSELDTEYAQSIMGGVKNTTDDAQTTAITSSTTWDAVYSGGVSAGLLADEGENDYEYVISFTGHKKSGTEVNGSYTISDAGEDTVQGLLSAIEATYEYEVSAAINTYGYIVITDKTTGNSQLDITITEPELLDFGAVTTSNLVGSQRNTNTDTSNAITKDDIWSKIDGTSLVNGDKINFSGYTENGAAVEGEYTVDTAEEIEVFLMQIQTAYNNAGGSIQVKIQDGCIMIESSTNNTFGIDIFEPADRGLDFGTISGGVTGRYAVDMTASKDGSDQLVLTHDEYGSSASFTISQSRDSSNTNYNQIIYTNKTNTTDTSTGDIYVSSSTKWDDIYGAGTIETGDTVTISGKDRSGNVLNPTGVSLTYDIDTANDIGDLLTRIVAVFADLNNTDPTTVDARIEQGKIIVEDQDAPTGTSQISLKLVYGGSGSLTLGDENNDLEESTTRDLDLGLVNGSRSGLDMVGTINSESATGVGQVLNGDAPATGETTSVEGLTIKYTGTETGAQGYVKITMGVGELFDRVLYNITNAADGYLDYRLESMGDRIDDLEDNIDEMEARLNRKMEMMINRFVAMELAMAKIQNQGQWLMAQISGSFSGWGSL